MYHICIYIDIIRQWAASKTRFVQHSKHQGPGNVVLVIFIASTVPLISGSLKASSAYSSSAAVHVRIGCGDDKYDRDITNNRLPPMTLGLDVAFTADWLYESQTDVG